jgi:hypothetical protein
MPIGYRIVISPQNHHDGEYIHHSGFSVDYGTSLSPCPNCRKNMFPAITLDFHDPLLRGLQIWNHPTLTLLFCPSCAFFMTPYYIDAQTGSVIAGGRLDGGKLVNPYMETIYESRTLHLASPQALESAEAFLTSLKDYRSRRMEEGVYHQIGGLPIFGRHISMVCCKCSSHMIFGGILDYDDLNIPLYESNHQPVSLIVGDKNSMNYYLCRSCSIIGMAWAK